MDAARFLILSVCFVSLCQAFQWEPTKLSENEGRKLLDEVLLHVDKKYDIVEVLSAFTDTELDTWYKVMFTNRTPDGTIERCDAMWIKVEDASIDCKKRG